VKKIKFPLTGTEDLRAGEVILASGTVYTARDQAHKRISEAIRQGKKLPFDLKGAVVYYCGPAKTPRGKAIGSCGPTTSSRMDEFAPLLIAKGLAGMIGKGRRSEAVRQAIKKHQAVYFLAYAGCGALLSKFVKAAKPVAYKELGPEAVYKLEIEDFPLIVGIDIKGRNIYGTQ
jgi:fumarate hydratase subunit beta